MDPRKASPHLGLTENVTAATERLYYTDTYLSTFEATVLGASENGQRVYLDRSAFYPASGGQPADHGRLRFSGDSPDAVAVVDVAQEGQVVAHLLSGSVSLLRGQAVRGEVEWKRRYDFMQQHTGQHLLSAVIEELFGYPTLSVHLGDDTSTVELGAAAFAPDQVKQSEERCLELITFAKPVGITFEDAALATDLRKASDRTGMLRIVTIEGVDRSACGGTHVRSLAEIGFVAIRRTEKVRGNMRLEFVAGARALGRVRHDYQLLTEMSKTCSVAVDDLAHHTASLQQRVVDAEKRAQRLGIEAAKRQGSDLFRKTAPDPDNVRRLWLTVPAISEEARSIAQAFVEEGGGIALILGTEQNTVIAACAISTNVNAASALKRAIAEHGGKGGGSSTMAQGSLTGADGVAALKRILGFS